MQKLVNVQWAELSRGNEEMQACCRDCEYTGNTGADSCPNCGSRRLLAHPDIDSLSIAHVDCDAFYASVEKRDAPRLTGKPVIVGGGKRGVVSAACYISRAYGVHSAMPMFKAIKACPHAVVIRPDHGKYSREGKRIKDMMLALTPQVESLSIDEAFMDMTGTERLHHAPPVLSLIRLQKRVKSEVGVTVSVGLSYNKFLAKTASDLDKPDGFSMIGRTEILDFLAPKPVDFIFGIGPAFARSLKKRGIITIADVRKKSDREMTDIFGEAGLRLARLARAEDHRPVRVRGVRKSVSSEITFTEDIGDETELSDELWQVSQRTADRAKAKNIAGRIVTLKLKTRGFQTLTRRRTLAEPVQLADTIFQAGIELLKVELGASKPKRRFRLIGIGISGLSQHIGDSTDLLDPKAVKRGQAERAGDKARKKFGKDALMTGRTLRQKHKRIAKLKADAKLGTRQT